MNPATQPIINDRKIGDTKAIDEARDYYDQLQNLLDIQDERIEKKKKELEKLQIDRAELKKEMLNADGKRTMIFLAGKNK